MKRSIPFSANSGRHNVPTPAILNKACNPERSAAGFCGAQLRDLHGSEAAARRRTVSFSNRTCHPELRRGIPVAVRMHREEARARTGLQEGQVPPPRTSFASGGCFDRLSMAGVVGECKAPPLRLLVPQSLSPPQPLGLSQECILFCKTLILNGLIDITSAGITR